ncbi:copper resistance protein NlpE N-terminal domain-containing protein [Maribacter sp. MMG018]|uniref:copper resistance protein NlpE N-terminal domain-containing protein n=1 Tax=Maribacter sp. MMG018 TaxID=2822688 RepID=UPI001B386DB2|nr:copper resistance protein NlpE N-terminal domain-containing protein [Maribacter sp. MMG018]MBQ4915870.1 copper resistance protein NlpE N-terminal domain-containing protein [Maribacter sp. MMG018]
MTRTHLKYIMATAITVTFMSSCAIKNKQEPTENSVDHHTAEIAFDWQGSYYGLLPCADCDGIATRLDLNNDLTYVLTKAWKKNDKALSDTLKGKFTWQGNNIKLEGIADKSSADTFKVEENRLRQLDMEGNEITSELATHYILSKMGNSQVEDKRWQIVELNGKQITGAPETHYIIFHSKEGRLEAKANCNILSRSYRITNQLMISIDQGISTMMACPDDLDSQLNKVLDMADNISVGDGTMTINKARMAPLVRLKLVE